MQKLIIQGPNKLNGEVKVSGSKNAALELIPAALLADSPSVIKNVPDILDIRNLLKIIEKLGGKATFKDNTVMIDPTTIDSHQPARELVGKLRASILLAAPLLSKFGKVEIPHPGGCNIGTRPIDLHFKAFQSLGIEVSEKEDHYLIQAKSVKGAPININFSVLGTGNAIMASVLAEGETSLKLAAAEPEILNLISFLKKMGADIRWIGNHELLIRGVRSLKGAEIETIPDRIEGGTFAIAAAATRSEVLINNFIPEHNDAFLAKLADTNVRFDLGSNYIHVKKGTFIKATNLRTNIYPGFATDHQPPFAILLTQAEGLSQIFETIFEGRLNYLYELEKMGAKIAIHDSHNATVEGPTPLYGQEIKSLDLRAGATLIIAAILAEGQSYISHAEIIDRGYEDIEGKFRGLGAQISRLEVPEAVS